MSKTLLCMPRSWTIHWFKLSKDKSRVFSALTSYRLVRETARRTVVNYKPLQAKGYSCNSSALGLCELSQSWRSRLWIGHMPHPSFPLQATFTKIPRGLCWADHWQQLFKLGVSLWFLLASDSKWHEILGTFGVVIHMCTLYYGKLYYGTDTRLQQVPVEECLWLVWAGLGMSGKKDIKYKEVFGSRKGQRQKLVNIGEVRGASGRLLQLYRWSQEQS